MMFERAAANLQWKGTEACYDFYCPCGYEGVTAFTGSETRVPDGADNHRDGFFAQEYRCAGCGRWWHFSNTIWAMPGRFLREGASVLSTYGCEHCASGHCSPGGSDDV